jgi:hypothetical protein
METRVQNHCLPSVQSPHAVTPAPAAVTILAGIIAQTDIFYSLRAAVPPALKAR